MDSSLQFWSDVAGWAAMGLTVATAIAFVVMATVIFVRETRRFNRLDKRINETQAELDVCYCDTFFFDDIFIVLNAADPTRGFMFDAGNITAGVNRTYSGPNKSGTVALLVDIVFPTVFLDSEFAIQNDPDVSKEFMFDAGAISLATTRIFAWQDTDGTVALLSDVPVVTSVFEDDVFAIQHAADMSREIMFDVSSVSTFSTRTFTWQDKNGTVAMISDIFNALGNVSQFLDSEFAILNDPDNTKVAMFDASAIATLTTRTYVFPNLDGTLMLTAGVQTISDKTWDSSNAVTLLNTNLFLQDDGDITKQLQFNIANQTTGVTTTATLPTSGFNITSSRELMFTLGGASVVVPGIKIFDDTALHIEDPVSNNAGQFDASNLTVPLRTYILPDKDGTLAFATDAIGPTFLDSAFGILNSVDTSKRADFDAVLITTATTRTFAFIDLTGTLFVREQMIGFEARRVSSQSIPTGVFTVILFDSDSTFGGNDPGGDYDTTTGIYTAPTTGYYTCEAHSSPTGNVGGGFVQLRMASNTDVMCDSIQPNVLQSLGLSCTSAHFFLTATQTVTAELFQASGVSITIGSMSRFGCWMVEQE